MTVATPTTLPQPKRELQCGADLDEELAFIMYLARDVLGYAGIRQMHIDWFEEALMDPKLLFLAPRSHYKTTCLTLIYTIYRIVRDPTVRILLLNEVLANAEDFLREIKAHMEHNDRFRSEFGALDRRALKWTERAIQIDSLRLTKDPTVSVAGTMGAINSKHVDLIICDDLISGKNTQTIHQRNKIKDWFYQMVMPILEPDGQIVVAGTRWHSADLYSDILNEERFSRWQKVVLKAEWDDDAGNHHILFPERFTQEKLDELRSEMGMAAYNAQYLNDPTKLEAQGFQRDWIKFYETEPASMNIFTGTDLAISKDERAAKFASVTIGIPSEGDIYILDCFAERLDFPQQCHMVKHKAAIWHPIRLGIESVAYQEALPQWLRADKDAKHLPLTSVVTRGDKIMRLTSLAPLFEQGIIRVRDDMHNFVDEYLGFPKGGTFDILDALFFAIQVSREMQVEPQITEIHL